MKSKNIYFLVIPCLFLAFFGYAKNISDCITIDRKEVCVKETENEDGELIHNLYVGSKKYSNISYYEDLEFVALNNKIKATSTFTNQGGVNVTAIITLKEHMPFLKKIYTTIRLNKPPSGVVEYCEVNINNFLKKDISFYVDSYIFNLDDAKRKKICVEKRN